MLKNALKFSTYKENITPKKIPKIVAELPIIIPIKKKIFAIDLFKTNKLIDTLQEWLEEFVEKGSSALKNKIGAKQVFIEDDSIFGMKRRAIRLLKRIVGFGLDLMEKLKMKTK